MTDKIHWATKARLEREAKAEQPIEQSTTRKGTRPGWKPASVLPDLKAPKGFTARWVRNDPGNIQRKMAEGWLLMKPSDNQGVAILQATTPDANPLASEIRYRDAIGMMLPDDMKQAREEYMRDENRSRQEQVLSHSDEQFKSHGVATYAPKGQAGRIVID